MGRTWTVHGTGGTPSRWRSRRSAILPLVVSLFDLHGGDGNRRRHGVARDGRSGLHRLRIHPIVTFRAAKSLPSHRFFTQRYNVERAFSTVEKRLILHYTSAWGLSGMLLFDAGNLGSSKDSEEDVTTEDTETPSAARKAADEDCALRRKPPLILGTTKDGWNCCGWKVRRPPFGSRK